MNLSKNEISSIHQSTFKGLSKLEELHLDYNKIKTLDPNLFNVSKNLRILYLNNNEISSIDENAFQGLSKLEGLCLNKNQITSLSSDLFNDCRNLRILNLSKFFEQ